MTAASMTIFGIIAYFAILGAAVLLSQPLRVRLAELADDMAAEPDRTKSEIAELHWLAASSASSVVGLMLPAASLFTLVSVILGARPRLPTELERLGADSRYHHLLSMYFLSVAACSPFAALLAVPPAALATALHFALGRQNVWGVAEASIVRASSALQPC